MLRAVFTRAQVQRLKESRLTIRGDGDQDPVALRRLRKGPSSSPNLLVSQSATLKEWSAQDCKRAKHKHYSHTDDVEGVWLFSSTTRWNSFRLWPSLVCRQVHRRRPGNDSFRYIFLKRYCTKFGQKFRVWPKEFSKRFPKLVIFVNLCQ